MNKKGFTLAEVLITIGIIGIVAAITIPNLITAYKKHQTVVRLKEAYSIFSRIVRLSSDENGAPSTWDYNQRLNFAQLYIIPYMTGVSELKTKYNVKLLNSEETYYFWQSSNFTQPIYQMNNGMTFTLGTFPSRVELTIIVDINGVARPNELGKDVFVFVLQRNANDEGILRPAGHDFSRTELLTNYWSACSKTAGDNTRGTCCAALIERDGWKISKDYPW